MANENYFEILSAVNVNDKTEKKNNLTYLSWAYAWGELKKRFPNANYKVYESAPEQGGWNYFTDGNTCWVKVGVTVNDIEHIEYLPIMDYKNKSIPLASVTSFEVNKAIQRALTKAVARHGLGLYIYAGEDLPDTDEKAAEKSKKPAPKTEAKAKVPVDDDLPEPKPAKAKPAEPSADEVEKAKAVKAPDGRTLGEILANNPEELKTVASANKTDKALTSACVTVYNAWAKAKTA